MEAVVCTQTHDGVETALVIPALVGETVADTLERKRQGALNRGWTVVNVTATSFDAWKSYADGESRPHKPDRKDRHFAIETR